MKKTLLAILSGLFLFTAGSLITAEIGDLSTTDASNTARFPEGMSPSAVNDAARNLEGLLARGLKDTIDGCVETAGTSAAYTVAANRTLTSYYNGLAQCIRFHTTTGAGPTINIDSIGAKNLVWPNGTQVTANNIVTGAPAIVMYVSNADVFSVLTVPAPPVASVISARGDLIIGASDASPTRLAVGSATTLLKSDGTDPSWAGLGNRTVWIPAPALIVQSSTGAALTTTEATASQLMIKTLDFDPDTAEFAQFNVAMPTTWDESTVTAQFHWTADGNSGDVIWSLQCAATSNDDAMDTTFGTAVSVTDTRLGTYDNHLSATSGAITCGGTPAAGDLVFFRVYRDATDAGDTLAVDAKLIGVKLLINTDAINDQ